jgi:hypothetical protein
MYKICVLRKYRGVQADNMKNAASNMQGTGRSFNRAEAKATPTLPPPWSMNI